MKIAIITITAGAGHLQAAAAIKEVLSADSSQTVEIMDVLEYMSPLSRSLINTGYVKLVAKSPELWSCIFKATDNVKMLAKHAKLRSQYDKHVNRRFFRHLAAFRPDLIVATHFMALDALGQEFDAPLACVITDFEAHALWISPHVDRYFAATERTKNSLVARGVDIGKILVTGIPIHPKFRAKTGVKQARLTLALRDDIPAVLVLGGGFGMGPIAETLQQLDKYPSPLQILVVSGRNEKLRKTLASKTWKQPVRVLGFVDNMQELLAASDMVVSKPGGLTSSEALAMGCPMLIFNPIPGQESANSDFLLENGAAVKVNRVQDIAPALSEVFEGDRLKQLKQNARKIGKPLAANDICNVLLSMQC